MSLNAKNITVCLITKDDVYPSIILNSVFKFPFGEVLIRTHCDSPHRKQELFEKAKNDLIYYQDDDCIAPIEQLLEQSDPTKINCAMKPSHLMQYAQSKIALLGWGSIFPKSVIKVLDKYRAEYGEDDLYKRETERIMTWLSYPQNRMELPIIDLPSAMAPDRLSMQPGHYDFIPIVEERCLNIATKARKAEPRSPGQLTVGVAMIVKNESVMLANCLDSVKDADEIVICDTGSEDNTMEIARRYTDKVYRVPDELCWRTRDDGKKLFHFANARNFAKSKMTTDWILSIDADETLHDFSKVREAVEQGFLAINVTLISKDNSIAHPFTRLFKNSPQVTWDRAVHNILSVGGEDIFPGWLDLTKTGYGDVRITYGFSPAHLLDPDRSLNILEEETKRKDAVRERFYLGREYWYRHRYEECVTVLGRYVQESQYLAEKADAFMIMARSYWEMKLPEDARYACMHAILINAHFKEAIDFMIMLCGDGRGNHRFQANADQWKKMAMTANNEGVLFVRH